MLLSAGQKKYMKNWGGRSPFLVAIQTDFCW